MLTPLQRRIATIIGGLPEAEQFALAGGGALIARGDVERQTLDLDFLGPAPQDVNRLMPAVEQALQDAGMNVRRIREAPGFFRIEVREHGEVTEVDLGADARILPVERGELGPILAGEELAVDKVLAVFGRAEARDFVDFSQWLIVTGSNTSVDGRLTRTEVLTPRCFARCSIVSVDSLGTSSICRTEVSSGSWRQSNGGADWSTI